MYDQTLSLNWDKLQTTKEISLSIEGIVSLELPKDLKNIKVRVKNNKCIHLMMFLSTDPGFYLEYFDNKKVYKVQIKNDPRFIDYITYYERIEGDTEFDIVNKHTLAEESVYLKIFCPYTIIGDEGTTTISLDFEMKPLVGKVDLFLSQNILPDSVE